MVIVAKFHEALGHRALIGDRDHAHPAPEHGHLIYGIEALRTTANLHDRERLALLGAHCAQTQWNPVNLRFHDASHSAMPLW